MNAKTVKFLRKYNYLFQLEETADGCILINPERVMDYYVAESITAYKFVIEGKTGIEISSSEFETLFVEAPKYAIPLIMSIEIQKACKRIGYDQKCINFIDLCGKDVDSINLTSKINLNELEKHKREVLDETFYEQIRGDFKDDISKKLRLFGIEEGYVICESIFNGSTNDES